jgi:hypothetical protein
VALYKRWQYEQPKLHQTNPTIHQNWEALVVVPVGLREESEQSP